MPKVLLTRPKDRTSVDNTFTAILKVEGIDVIEIPMITISYPKDISALTGVFEQLAIGEFDYCVLSSPTAIE